MYDNKDNKAKVLAMHVIKVVKEKKAEEKSAHIGDNSNNEKGKGSNYWEQCK